MEAKALIEEGSTCLGIELGSTRIKAVLTDAAGNELASGGYGWENHYDNGIWTYPLDEVERGVQGCYADLKKNVLDRYGVKLTKLGAVGISAMMHGYLVFDKNNQQLAQFRTWRNTITKEAAEQLTAQFQFNIPQRWSISHLYQAILNGEDHVSQIDFITTLAGYVHWKLTGEKVLGIGDASGMFPIDPATRYYNSKMLQSMDDLLKKNKMPFTMETILPKALLAGEHAGSMTREGAAFLDATGELEAGCPLCPPEGDAGTGMTATNSVAVRTGNVSAGTSVFAMIVLEKPLSKVYPKIDIVTTPDGAEVAMVHCNNCTSDINAWVNLFDQFATAIGAKLSKDELFTLLYSKAIEGDPDCGGLLSYNYFSGEPVTGFEEGVPVVARSANDAFTLPNFMRMHLTSALAALKVGLDLLLNEENVKVDEMYGHGGFFKTKGVGSKIAAAAMNSPVTVMESAGEGGAWGIALLASYMLYKKEGESLSEFLNSAIFADQKGSRTDPDAKDVEGFNKFMERYQKGLSIEAAAVDSFWN